MLTLGTLFFIFGLVSWVNAILIPYFKVACELTHTQSYLVALAFYIAYLVMSIPASRLLNKVGYKRGIRIGLWFMAAGTLLFVPAAYTRTYGIFLTGLFTIGTGLAILQTAANPYVVIIGPIESAARRISIMGLCNKIAGILAPLLFAAVILKSSDSALFEMIRNNAMEGAEKSAILNELIRRVIVPYTLLSSFLFLFGCAIRLIRLPDITAGKEDEDATHTDRDSILNYPYLILGAVAIFFHVAAQVISIDTVISYAEMMELDLNEAKIFPSITMSCALVGYGLGILLIPRVISQKNMLRVSSIAGLLLSLCFVGFGPRTSVRNGYRCLYLVSLPDGRAQRPDLCRYMAAGHSRSGTVDQPRLVPHGHGLVWQRLHAGDLRSAGRQLQTTRRIRGTHSLFHVPDVLRLLRAQDQQLVTTMERNQMIHIYNGEILTPKRNLGIGTVTIEGNKIIGIQPGNTGADDYLSIDARGGYIAPGFIDIHTHGAGNADFMDCTEEACLTIARTHARYGTTLLYPTTLASDNEELFRFLDIYDRVKHQQEGTAFGGLHLEGPYFSYAFRGAQDPKFLRDPHPSEYMEILERSQDIVRWSLAPELPGALELADELCRRGIKPSVAHTDAVYEDIVEAHKHGFRHITHFYSCMNGITRRNAFRYAGCIEAGYLIDDLCIELIADGIHVPEPLM